MAREATGRTTQSLDLLLAIRTGRRHPSAWISSRCRSASGQPFCVPRYPGLTVRRDRDAVVVHVPMRLYRRNGRQTLLTPEGHKCAPERQANQPLVEALAKAHRWQEQLEAGEHANIDDLAKAIGVDRTYAARILKLTGLAPDIVEAILAGKEPEGVSLRRLQKELSVCWGE